MKRFAFNVSCRLRRLVPDEAARIAFLLVVSLVLFGMLAVHFHFDVEMRPVDRILYYGLLVGLFYCCISYQISRFGAARRAVRHRAFSDAETDYLFAADAPSVTILVPSYREERRVLVMTMLSAALARYSNRRLVLLVDDPPTDRASVAQTLAAVAEVKADARGASALCCAPNVPRGMRRSLAGSVVPGDEAARLARNYGHAADWLDSLAKVFEAEITAEFAHVDRFFIDRIIGDLARRYRGVAAAFAGRGTFRRGYR